MFRYREAYGVPYERYGVAVYGDVAACEILYYLSGLTPSTDQSPSDPGDLVVPSSNEFFEIHDFKIFIIIEESHRSVWGEASSYGLDHIYDLQGHQRVCGLHLIVYYDFPLSIDIDVDAGDVLNHLLRLAFGTDDGSYPILRYSYGSHCFSLPFIVFSSISSGSMISTPLFLKNLLMLLISLMRKSLALK